MPYLCCVRSVLALFILNFAPPHCTKRCIAISTACVHFYGRTATVRTSSIVLIPTPPGSEANTRNKSIFNTYLPYSTYSPQPNKYIPYISSTTGFGVVERSLCCRPGDPPTSDVPAACADWQAPAALHCSVLPRQRHKFPDHSSVLRVGSHVHQRGQ